jgi:hypothetical protein
MVPRHDGADVQEDGLRCQTAVGDEVSDGAGWTYRGEELIDDVLESVILRLHPEPIVPREAVADDETAENIVRAKDADHAEGEEGEGDSEREKRFVVDQAGPDQLRSQKHRIKGSGIPSLFGETKDLASDIANYSANEDRQANLV